MRAQICNSTNVRSKKNNTKPSSNTLLGLVLFFSERTLDNSVNSVVEFPGAGLPPVDLHWFFEIVVTSQNTYRTRAIITRGLHTFYPIFDGQKRLFKELFS